MPTKHYTPDQYIELDEAAPKGVRLEYLDGTIYFQGQVFEPSMGWDAAHALAGASPEHSIIKHNVELLIGNQLRERECMIVSSDLRVEVATKSGYVYPDIVITCDPAFDGVNLRTPELLIEILSKSTAKYDLTNKKAAYATIPTMKEYWFVAQTKVDVFQCIRSEGGWTFHRVTELDDAVESDSFGLSLPVREVYRHIF